MINNRNRWSNFNNDELYSKYKQSQAPVASAPAQRQQQGGDEWQTLGRGIGDTWKKSMARKRDGEFAGQKMNRLGVDQNITDEQLANMPKGFQNGYNAEQDAMQTVAHPETAMNTFGDGTGATFADQIAGQYGTDAMTQAGTNAMSNIGANAATNIGTNVAADLGTSAAIQGGAAAGEAIGAGGAAAAEGAGAAAAEGAGASAAGAGASSVLGPLAAIYGVYTLGDMFDWW